MQKKGKRVRGIRDYRENLVLDYYCGEDLTGEIKDHSGHNNNGTVIGAERCVQGYGDLRGIKGDGVDDYWTISDCEDIRLDDTDFTLTALVYLNEFGFGTNDGENPYLINKSYYERGGYLLKAINNAADGSNGRFYFNIKTGQGTVDTNKYVETSNNYYDKKWYLIHAVFINGGGFEISVNGEVDGVSADTTAMSANTVDPLQGMTESSGGNHNMDGIESIVKIRTVALTREQRMQEYLYIKKRAGIL